MSFIPSLVSFTRLCKLLPTCLSIKVTYWYPSASMCLYRPEIDVSNVGGSFSPPLSVLFSSDLFIMYRIWWCDRRLGMPSL